ncbi:MAG: hypothetical protein AB7H97_21350 [Pseudobdellovibrionaceae bacterium]
MLKRVFEIDVTVCPKCAGRMEQIAIIKDKKVAREILKSLKISKSREDPSNKLPQNRGPPETGAEEYNQADPTW